MKQKKMLRFGALLLALVLCLSATVFAADATTGFRDVAESDSFYPAVQWGLENEITNGVSGTRFDPNGTVTRAQAVTFLWRMAGKPEPTVTETFSDVVEGSWYETAVQWAVETGVTEGTGGGKFSPEMTLDRAMCLTMLYRMKGSPLDVYAEMEPVEMTEDATLEELAAYMIQQIVEAIRGPEVFPDLEAGSYYEMAAVYAAMSNILTADNTGAMVEGVLLRPEDPCIRSEMISFLYQEHFLDEAANAPELLTVDNITVPIPQSIMPLLNIQFCGTGDGEEGALITVCENKSVEAAEAMGEYSEGIGELFTIERISEDTMHEMRTGDMSGEEIFAMDEDGMFYVFRTPTDVRMVRETPEEMEADQEIWEALNAWAKDQVPSGILENSEELYPVRLTNTVVDQMLARVAYQDGTRYTVSTTEFGPLEPGEVDPDPYAENLMSGCFEPVEDAQAPDGEYVVLNFPEEGLRLDFFAAEGNLVRVVSGEDETFYTAIIPDPALSNAEIMQAWYDALAVAVGKKEPTPIQALEGQWVEEIAGRATVTFDTTVNPNAAIAEVVWPDGASVHHRWVMAVTQGEDGKFSYTDGVYIVYSYDEEGNETLVSQDNDQSGTFELNEEGKLIWTYGEETATFISADAE